MTKTESFRIERVLGLVARARRARDIPVGLRSAGWRRSPVDPMDLLRVFKPLGLKRGFTLCAFIVGEANGNGVVWAVPSGPLRFENEDEAAFLDPSGPRDLIAEFDNVTRGRNPPRPIGAVDDLRSLLFASGSCWSYVCASLFAREAAEFGAEWHGCFWSDWKVVGGIPRLEFDKVSPGSDAYESPWTWLEPEPSRWEPTVTMTDDEVVVVFHAFTEFGSRRITRFTDHYKPGSYVFRSEPKDIALAGGGLIH